MLGGVWFKMLGRVLQCVRGSGVLRSAVKLRGFFKLDGDCSAGDAGTERTSSAGDGGGETHQQEGGGPVRIHPPASRTDPVFVVLSSY